MHQSNDPSSDLHPDSPYYPLIPAMKNLTDEPVFVKSTSSAFVSTNLEAFLQDRGIANLYVMGAVAGFCVNTTTRHGADLGFTMHVVKDAVISFDGAKPELKSKNIYAVTLGLLGSDFAHLLNHNELISRLIHT